jgi:linoleoyl-CoA desaturase
MTATVMEKVKIKHTDFARDVRELQRKKELYHPSARDISRMFKIDVAVLVLLYATAIAFGLYAKEHGFSLLASLPAILTLLLFSVFLIRFAFKAHNFDHARAENSLLYFKGVDFFVGASSFIWQSQHFATHHKYPNTFYNGENLDSSNRKVFFSERSYDQRAGAKQAGKFASAVSLLLASLFYKQLMFLVFAVAFFKGNYMPHSPQRKKVAKDYAFYLVSKLCLIVMYYVVPFYLFGVYGVIGYFIVSILWSAVFYLSFESNHHGMLSKAIYINTEEELAIDFAKLQLSVTLNVGTDNKFYRWLIYDFNYHIEHHLFPAVDVSNYPELSRELKQLVNEKYPELNYYELGCAEALLSVLKQYLFKPQWRSVVIHDGNRLDNILT